MIDLSADFRIKDPQTYEQFYAHKHPAPALLANSVYGLPERYRQSIRTREFSGLSRLLSDRNSGAATAFD